MTQALHRLQSDPNRLMSATETASLYGMGRSWLYAEVSAGRIPKPYKIGSRSRWKRSEILQDIEVRTAKQSAAA